MALIRGNLRFYEMLLRLNTDDVITWQDILNATGWTEVSLKTYVNKNKLSPFLLPIGGNRFRVMRAGPTLNEQEVERALTQVSHNLAARRGADIWRSEGQLSTRPRNGSWRSRSRVGGRAHERLW
jgi:hypothetical protein